MSDTTIKLDFYCPHCLEQFEYKRNLDRHLKVRSSKCIDKEELINREFEKRTAEREKRKELTYPLLAQKTHVEELIKSSSNNTRRKKNYTIFEIIRNSDVDIETLMEMAISGSKKTAELIERIVFTSRSPNDWNIKIVDFSRQKFAYYDKCNSKWTTVTIDDITENFMIQLTQLYDRVIIQKSKEFDDINKKYPYHASDGMAEKNIFEANKIHEKYAFCTQYRLCLLSGIDEPNLYSALKTRLLNLFNKYL